MDAMLHTEQLPTDREILDLVTNPCDAQTSNPDECDPEPEPESLPPVSRRQARNGLDEAIRYLQQQAGTEGASPEVLNSSAALI